MDEKKPSQRWQFLKNNIIPIIIWSFFFCQDSCKYLNKREKNLLITVTFWVTKSYNTKPSPRASPKLLLPWVKMIFKTSTRMLCLIFCKARDICIRLDITMQPLIQHIFSHIIDFHFMCPKCWVIYLEKVAFGTKDFDQKFKINAGNNFKYLTFRFSQLF